MNWLPVAKDIEKFADFQRKRERDLRLKSPHMPRGYKRDLGVFEESRARRPMTKLLVEEYAAAL